MKIFLCMQDNNKENISFSFCEETIYIYFNSLEEYHKFCQKPYIDFSNNFIEGITTQKEILEIYKIQQYWQFKRSRTCILYL